MKILIFIKEVLDYKIPLEYDAGTGRLKASMNVSLINPEDAAAIDMALRLKDFYPGTHITLIHLGPPSAEQILREGLALGCDAGLRLWDEDLADIHVQGKSIIFARIANILSFDLILTGVKSLDTGSAQLGVLLASALQVPFICSVSALSIEEDNTVLAIKSLTGGYQERVMSPTPLVIAVQSTESLSRYATLPVLLETSETMIPCMDLSQIGIARQTILQADSVIAYGPLRYPAAKLKFLKPPDSSLPGFDRRKQLLEGSMTQRTGKIVKGEEDFIVDELFRTLLNEGWLDHLHNNEEHNK